MPIDAGQRRVSVDLRRSQYRQRVSRSSYQQSRLDFGGRGRRLPRGVGRAGLADGEDRTLKVVGAGGAGRSGGDDRGRLPAG